MVRALAFGLLRLRSSQWRLHGCILDNQMEDLRDYVVYRLNRRCRNRFWGCGTAERRRLDGTAY